MTGAQEFEILNLLLADFYVAVHSGKDNGSKVNCGIRITWTELDNEHDARLYLLLSARKFEDPEELVLGLSIAPGVHEVMDHGRLAGRHSLVAYYANLYPTEDRISFMERALGPL